MNILLDINHPVDVNFFKNALEQLKLDGHTIDIIFRYRGKLEKILRYELEKFQITQIGAHQKGFIKKIIFQLKRDFKIISFIKNHNIDLVICFGSTAAIASWYCGKPYLAFDDDFEYKIPFYHANWFSTRHIYPDFIKFSNSKTFKYHGFKELAYLHPKYLKTSTKVLDEYSITPNQYVFIREIASVSLNYKDSTSILTKLVENIKKKGLKIILSIEDKGISHIYADDCIILEEPVSDIYSLLYHSLFAISSGDTVARETALLGVPTIYTGGRNMVIHKPLVDNELMYEEHSIEKISILLNDLTIERKKNARMTATKLIEKNWEDTTALILKHINDFV